MGACVTLNERLASYKAKHSKWEDACAAAVADGVGLAAFGKYQANSGKDYNAYATYAVSCSEVEIDVLTGEIQIIRADIHADQGTSLNPDIDIGQIEGGFVMTLGHIFTEQVLFNAQYQQLNLSTWEYKIPSAYDIPMELNVSLLADAPNPSPAGCLKSKASAEPAMPTALSALFAAKAAIYAARADAGNTDHFQLSIPVTVEQIQRS